MAKLENGPVSNDEFTLEGYSGLYNFLRPLQTAMLKEKQRESGEDAIPPVILFRQKIDELPDAAVYPAMEAVRWIFAPPVPGSFYKASGIISEEEIQIHAYVTSVITKEEKSLPDEEQQLQKRYQHSKIESDYFALLKQQLSVASSQGRTALQVIDRRWATLETQSDVPVEEVDLILIASMWGTLIKAVNQERKWEKDTREIAEEGNIYYFDNQSSAETGPRILFKAYSLNDLEHIDTKEETYNYLSVRQKTQRTASIAHLEKVLASLEEVPAEALARALFIEVFDSETRDIVVSDQLAYERCRDTLEKVSGFTDYRDPSYRGYVQRHRDVIARMHATDKLLPKWRDVLLGTGVLPVETEKAIAVAGDVTSKEGTRLNKLANNIATTLIRCPLADM